MTERRPSPVLPPAPGNQSRLWLPDSALTLPAPIPRLKLLSFNIQLGLRTSAYHHYLSRAWRHALPGVGMHDSLDGIAELLRGYDFVALQEADAGSLRTRFTNQIEYLARRAGFPHYGLAVTRNLRPVARHCMGFLSRLRPAHSTEHVLPSRIPGRRALSVDLGAEAGGLRILLAHLSLGRADQERQLHFLGDLVRAPVPAVLMGDLNCESPRLLQHAGLQRSGLGQPHQAPPTYPSWRPRLSLDHLLVTPGVHLHRIEALPFAGSDHLPLSAEISINLPT